MEITVNAYMEMKTKIFTHRERFIDNACTHSPPYLDHTQCMHTQTTIPGPHTMHAHTAHHTWTTHNACTHSPSYLDHKQCMHTQPNIPGPHTMHAHIAQHTWTTNNACTHSPPYLDHTQCIYELERGVGK